jgi:hypothetical protein
MKDHTEFDPVYYLLSYNKPTKVSSTLSNDHAAAKAVDEIIRTWWSASTGNSGEYFQVDLEAESTINAVQVNFADEGATQYGWSTSTYYQYVVEVSDDGNTWKTIIDKSANTADLPHELVELETPVTGRYVKVTNKRTPAGSKFSLFGFRVFGSQDKAKPAAPGGVAAKRESDKRQVTVSWNAVAGAVGYNIRFGEWPEKLYTSAIVYGQATTSKQLIWLNTKTNYYFAVDAFNEAGITRGTEVVEAAI